MGGEQAAPKADLRDYLRPLVSRLWLVALIVVVVTVGTYVYYDRKPEVYESSTTLFVAPSNLNQILFGSLGQDAETIDNLAILLRTTAVAREAAKEIDFKGEPSALLGSISAEGQGDSDFILVAARAATPKGAAALANAFAEGFIRLRAEQVRDEADDALEATKEELSQLGGAAPDDPQRTNLESQIQQLRLIRSLPAEAGGSGLRQIEIARPPAEPIEPDPVGNAIFAFALSLVLGIGAAFGLDRLDRRIRQVEDVEDAYGQPVLTELPTVSGPAPIVDGVAGIADPFREPFRRLETNLEMLSLDTELKTIVVASAVPGEGKSIVARNLALAYREAGKRVALVDTDFRKSSLTQLLGAEDGPGLAEVLSGATKAAEALQEVPVEMNGHHEGDEQRIRKGVAAREGALALMTTGPEPANPSAVLGTGRMRETLATTAEDFHTVIVDSPPVLAVSDSLPLLAAADGVILVARIGVTTRDSVRRLQAQLEQLPDLNVLGVVVNGVPARTHRSRAYGYGSGYHYGSR